MSDTAPSLTFRRDEDRWEAVATRNAAADGVFWYGVKTTGVYCRPSCAARRPLRRNVSYHTSCSAAEKAGFQACKRCQPSGPSVAELHAAIVTRACRILSSSDASPLLDDLAREVGMSSYHFHRVFKKITGLTPRVYAEEHRSEKVRSELTDNNRVTDALYEAGFGSGSTFYKQSKKILGMKPRDYQQGGRNEAIHYACSRCALGNVLVASTSKGLCAITLGDDPEAMIGELKRNFPKALIHPAGPEFGKTVASVVKSIESPNTGMNLPLDIRGSVFQKRVWQALAKIPCGSTLSYSEVAGRIGQPSAVRAVASACAANKLAVVIPCHRVLRSDGSLSGYRWGLERKRTLLDREAESKR